MKVEKVSISLRDGKTVSGTVAAPPGNGAETGIIFAHGAGNDMNQPMIVFLAEGMARAGYLTLRFNFHYMEQGKRTPDRQDLLYDAWDAAFQFLGSHVHPRPKRIFAAGKSMGGRIAAQMAARGQLAARRLIFLGYPLHPPGRKDALRDEPLYRIGIPMLFFAGTRDPLCDLPMLSGVLARLSAPHRIEVIEGGDHSFKVPKAMGMSPEEIYNRILERALEWMNE
ncbi:MAG TPA: dienelactone hydrolase family protein [Syntrophobacteraceae bacterium]|nr:dienelactone hydrolase family protein [Syntrophobacteraceae bacterium]